MVQVWVVWLLRVKMSSFTYTEIKIPMLEESISEIKLREGVYTFFFQWNSVAGIWMLSIKRSKSEEWLVSSQSLVAGFDLLERSRYKNGLKGALIFIDSTGSKRKPMYENIGEFSLFYIVEG